MRPQRPAERSRQADGVRSGPPAPGLRAAVADRQTRAEHDLGFVTRSRSTAEFERAQRHSRRVRFLRLALPLGGAATIVLLVAAYVITQFSLPSVDIEAAKVVDGKLVMANPKLAGSDGSNRPWSLTAERALQDAARPTRITLEKIEATLPVDGDNAADIEAGVGVYDADAKTLELSGTVSVALRDGMTIRLEDAAIDIGTGKLTTSRPVAIDAGRARVTARKLTVENRGKTIVFEDSVRMTLYPAGAAAKK